MKSAFVADTLRLYSISVFGSHGPSQRQWEKAAMELSGYLQRDLQGEVYTQAS